MERFMKITRSSQILAASVLGLTLAGAGLAVWTDLAKMKPATSATKEAKFRFVFSQRRAMRLKRSSLPTVCSIRARPL